MGSPILGEETEKVKVLGGRRDRASGQERSGVGEQGSRVEDDESGWRTENISGNTNVTRRVYWVLY